MRVASAALVSWFSAVAWSGRALAQFAPAPSAPPPPGTQPAGSPSTLSAAGLAPPPAVETAPAPGAQPAPTAASTEARLDRADREDSGRGLEFVWLNAEVGVIHIGLATFEKTNPYARVARANETGFVAGGAAGVRLVFLTLGARFRYASMPDYHLWSLGLEGGVHAPFGNFEPYGALGLGYASLGSSSISGVQGFDARLAAGADYYFTPMFSLGLNVSGELFVLHRTLSPCCGEGTGTAAAVSATAVAGLHF